MAARRAPNRHRGHRPVTRAPPADTGSCPCAPAGAALPATIATAAVAAMEGATATDMPSTTADGSAATVATAAAASKGTADASAAVPSELVAMLRKEFAGNAAWRVAQNAVAEHSVTDVSLSREAVVAAADVSYSIRVDDWPVTNQRQSGRCGGLNGGRRRAR